MSGLERQAVFKPGASFFEEGGEVFFQYQLDAGSVIGPRKVKDADKIEHAFEWERFNEGRLPQLDHDGDGFPGGSLPHVEDAEPVAKRRGRPPKGA